LFLSGRTSEWSFSNYTNFVLHTCLTLRKKVVAPPEGCAEPFFDTNSRLVEEIEHITEQNKTEKNIVAKGETH